MIRNIEIEGFQGAREARVKLGAVTFVAGRNGSGKTSVAEAIEFALLGESPRGGVAADVIGHSSDAAEVEITLDDGERTALRRRQTPGSPSSRWVDGTKASDKAFDSAVRAKVGDPRAIRAALRSGGLLEMKSDDLQRFLADLTGAAFDARTIASAIGPEAAEAAKRLGLPLPATLGDFPSCEKKAVERRVAAKRVEKEREGDLARLPGPDVDPGERALDDLQAQLRATREAHESAVKAEASSSAAAVAKREERIAALREQVEKGRADVEEARAGLAQVKCREVATLERELATKRAEAAKAEAALAEARRQVAAKEPEAAGATPDDERLAADLLSRERAKKAALDAFTKARDERDATAKEWEATSEKLKKAPTLEPCPNGCQHCTVRNAQKIEAELRAKLDELNEKGKAARERQDQAKATLDAAQIALEAAEGAADRIEAARVLADTRAAAVRFEAEAKGTRAAEAALVEELDTARKVRGALKIAHDRANELTVVQGELEALEGTPLPPAPETKSTDLFAQLARDEQLVEAARQRDARARAKKALDAVAEEIADADLVARMLGAKGAKAELLARGVKPFLDAANGALTLFAPGWSVRVESDPFGIVLAQGDAVFRPGQLSDGHRTRMLFVLQFAIAQLSRIGLVVFDRAELLDAEGRAGLDQLLATCAEERIQALVLLHGDVPPSVDEIAVTYAMDAGVARRVENSVQRVAVAAGGAL